MDRDDVLGLLGIAAIIVLIGYGAWWMAVGESRSTYNFCITEYLKVRNANITEVNRNAFDYCYERTY